MGNFKMEISISSMGSPTLTKAELSALLFEQLGLNKREAKDFVDAFFETMLAQLAQGQDVKVSGFGNFEVRAKSSRPGIDENQSLVVTFPESEATKRKVLSEQVPVKAVDLNGL